MEASAASSAKEEQGRGCRNQFEGRMCEHPFGANATPTRAKFTNFSFRLVKVPAPNHTTTRGSTGSCLLTSCGTQRRGSTKRKMHVSISGTSGRVGRANRSDCCPSVPKSTVASCDNNNPHHPFSPRETTVRGRGKALSRDTWDTRPLILC